ncbi:nitrite reductase [Irpex rosettiformis]|uniref:Nitrite reductase n=1 Tax=Irpex rosettiformis TaxID=378272 RepID=A0ACB8TVX8_9APHY|nr:nitrite reductase [Irpex rosettiformis]
MVSPESRKTIFVVGLGMVGIAFIEKILNLDTSMKYKVVTCGEESHLAYNRVSLTDYFQHRNVEKLYLNPLEWYTSQDPSRFEFFLNEAVVSISPSDHTVTTSTGRKVSYDICVLATGSDAIVPDFVDRGVKGVFAYRNISDLNALLQYSDLEGVKGEPTAVVGAGLLGLEAAKALCDLSHIPSNVSIIGRKAYPLNRQLDESGGEIVLRRIEALGVRFIGNVEPTALVTSRNTDGEEVLEALQLTNGSIVPCKVAVFSIGIKPRDELALESGIVCEGSSSGTRGKGVKVDDELRTSAQDIYAIGECASWNGRTFGLIAPGVEMADILAFNLTQTETEVGEYAKRKMNTPDLSTKLKLVGVDVASFGDYFVDQMHASRSSTKISRISNPSAASSAPLSHNQQEPLKSMKPTIWEVSDLSDGKNTTTESGPIMTRTRAKDVSGVQLQAVDTETKSVKSKADASSPRKRHGLAANLEAVGVETLTYRDPFAGVYKKYIFTADGKYILGGMMVGDTGDYVRLLALVKKKKTLEVPPSQFIAGSSAGADDGADLDDDTQICSCHNVTKGQVAACVRDGADSINTVKQKTKAGTGCGGCVPLLTSIFKAEMVKSGHEVNNNLCPHFAMSRAELFNVTKIKKLKTFTDIMSSVGVNKDSVGCEVCKPAIGSILASLWNEHIMNPAHHANQDTNDRFLANIQRNGTFSVIPRIAAGEITPDKLIALGTVGKKYNLYTKITGGQRVDLFGAQKADLPSIWKELIDAGFESGHGYGKALRTVKSCVGTNWCRYGIGDSVGLAITLEERYKGVRSPHKIKGGVSGCVRECAEAQSKDFGLIATDKGWNVFICGNGGAVPKHAVLFATDVPPSKVVRIVDRFLMYYIRTADKLMRTARWLEQMDGGIERLKKVLLDDELGICAELEQEMDELVGTYFDEWKTVVDDQERQKQFRQFVNTDERVSSIEPIVQRGQLRPANWAKSNPEVLLKKEDIPGSRESWKWRRLAKVQDLTPSTAGTTSAAVKYGDSHLAIFHIPRRGYYATQQMCPHKRAFVLEHGIIGDDPNSGNIYVSCPMHKLEDDGSDDISILLPEPEDLDQVIGTKRWVVKRDTAKALDGEDHDIDGVEIVGPNDEKGTVGADGCGSTCGGKLDW